MRSVWQRPGDDMGWGWAGTWWDSDMGGGLGMGAGERHMFTVTCIQFFCVCVSGSCFSNVAFGVETHFW